MVEKLADDYAKYFQKFNIDKEINPLCLSIEEMLARLDEFETLLTNVKIDTNSIMDGNITQILEFRDNFQSLCERIDKLEKFVDVVNENVNTVEKTVGIAETELDASQYSLKGLLIPLFSRGRQTDSQCETNLKDGEFQEVPIFHTSDYFPPQ